jgi:hypothetical protein
LSDVINAVTEFIAKVLLLSRAAILSDVINAVTEFMVRVLLPSRAAILGCTMLLGGLTPGHACDAISAVAGFMVDVAGVKAL